MLRIFRRGADQDFLGPADEVQFCLFAAGEKSGRFEHDLDSQIFPRQFRRVALLQDLDLVPADDDVLIVVADLAVKFPMDRIPFEKVSQGVGVGQIVDRADLDDLILRHGARRCARCGRSR